MSGYALLGFLAYAGLTLVLMFIMAGSRQINNFGAMTFFAALLLLGGLAVLVLALPRRATDMEGAGRWRWAYVPLMVAVAFILFVNLRVWTGNAHYSFGISAVSAGWTNISVRELRTAIDDSPGQDMYYSALGQAYEAAAGQAKEGKSLSYTPGPADARNLALASLSSLQKDDLRALAAAAYQGAIDRAPLNARHYLEMANLYRTWGQTGAAEQLTRADAFYREAASLSPNDPQLFSEWADLALARNNVAMAEQKVAIALSKSPNFWFANYQMARVREQQGNLAQAARDAELALKGVRTANDHNLITRYLQTLKQKSGG